MNRSLAWTRSWPTTVTPQDTSRSSSGTRRSRSCYCSIAAPGSRTCAGLRWNAPHRWPALAPQASSSARSPRRWWAGNPGTACRRCGAGSVSAAGWIWIPRYTADAIARWQAERGQTRSALFDQKDREFAQLLFVHRGKGMGLPFLNRRLIPVLCDKAGVAPRDAEGAYTAHRGRSARISMLHACGLELEDLAAYAIHKNTETIKKYARRNPIHLHRRVAQADTLSTVIEDSTTLRQRHRAHQRCAGFWATMPMARLSSVDCRRIIRARSEWIAQVAVCSSAASRRDWCTTPRTCSG